MSRSSLLIAREAGGRRVKPRESGANCITRTGWASHSLDGVIVGASTCRSINPARARAGTFADRDCRSVGAASQRMDAFTRLR